jgi:hypothetical protein
MNWWTSSPTTIAIASGANMVTTTWSLTSSLEDARRSFPVDIKRPWLLYDGWLGAKINVGQRPVGGYVANSAVLTEMSIRQVSTHKTGLCSTSQELGKFTC